MSDPLTVLAELQIEVVRLAARVDELERESSKRWLTVDEAAAYLGITAKAVRRRADRGRLPVIRDGGRVYLDRDALDATFAAKGSTLPATTQMAAATRKRPTARPQEVTLP